MHGQVSDRWLESRRGLAVFWEGVDRRDGRPVSARTTASAAAPARRRHEELIRVGQEMKEARRKDTTVS